MLAKKIAQRRIAQKEEDTCPNCSSTDMKQRGLRKECLDCGYPDNKEEEDRKVDQIRERFDL